MATVTFSKKTVFGDMRVNILNVVCTGTTENVDTGLDYIYGHSIGVKSMSTNLTSWVFTPNVGAAATALVGIMGVTGAVVGDEFCMVVYGK